MIKKILIKMTRVMLWTVLGITLALAVIVSILHTTWGRSWLKQQVVIMIEKEITGTVTIQSIQGAIPHRPILEKVTLKDQQGAPIFHIDAVAMHFSLLELFNHTLRAKKITVIRPSIFLASSDQGHWNLSTLIKPSKQSTEDKKNGWIVKVDTLKIDNGSLDIHNRDENPLRFQDIQLELAASYGSSEAYIELMDASFQLPLYNTTLSVLGSFSTDFTKACIGNLVLKTNQGSTLSSQGCFSNDGQVDTDISMHLNHKEAGRFLPFVQPKENINLSVKCSRSKRNKPFKITLKTDSSGMNLQIEAFADPSQASVSAFSTLENLDLSKINPNLPNSSLNLINETKLTWSHPPYLKGTSHGEIRGMLDTIHITQSNHVLVLDQQSISTVLNFATTRGSGNVKSTFSLGKNGFEIVNSNTTASINNFDFSGLSSQKSLLEITTTKKLQNHFVRSDFELDNLSYESFNIAHADFQAAYSNIHGKTNASASLSLDDIRHKDLQLGKIKGTSSLKAYNNTTTLMFSTIATNLPIEMNGRIGVQRRPDRAVAEIDYLSIRTQEVDWTAANGSLTWQSDGRLYTDNLKLTSRIGSLSLDVQRRNPAKASINLDVQNLDLHGLHEALPILKLPNLCGRLNAHLKMVKKPIGIELETSGSFSKICIIPESPTLFGTFQSTVKAGKLALELQARDTTLGGLTVSARAGGPNDPFGMDIRRLPQNILMENLDVNLDAIDIAGIADRLGFRFATGGKLSGHIQLRPPKQQPSHSTIWIDLNMQDMLLPAISQPLSIDIKASLEPNQLNAQIEPFFPTHKNITIKTQHQFGYSAFLEGRFDTLQTSRFSMHADIKPTSARQISDILQLSSSLDGVIAAKIKASGSLLDPTISVQASWTQAGIAGVDLDNLDLDFNTSTGVYKLRVTGLGPNTGSFELDAHIDPETALPVRISLYADEFDLGRFHHLCATNRRTTKCIDGILDANLVWSTDLNPPTQTGWLHVRNARLEIPGTIPPLRNLELVLTVRNRWLSANCLAQAESGSLAASLDMDLRHWPSLSSEIDVSMRNLPLPVAGQTWGLDLDASMVADYASRLWKIENNIRNAVVYLPQNMQGSYYDTKALEDVRLPDEQVPENNPNVQSKHATLLQSDTIHMLIRTKEPVGVRNQDIEARLVFDLEVYDVNTRPSITGNVQTTEGYVMLFDRKYEIQNAKAIFKGKTPPDPEINIVLIHNFDTMTLKVSIEGTVHQPKVALSSEPAVYEQTQLLAFVLGSDPDDPAAQEKKLEDRATGVASNLLLSKVQQEIKRALPIDTLRVKTDKKQGKTTGGLLVGKWITDNIYLAYRYQLGAKDFDNINEANVTYRLTKEWILEAIYGDRGKGSLDLLWIKRF